MATDPVCGREVDPSVVNQAVGQVPGGANEINPAAGTKRFHDGKWWYFCSVGCRQKFVTAPTAYIAKSSG